MPLTTLFASPVASARAVPALCMSALLAAGTLGCDEEGFNVLPEPEDAGVVEPEVPPPPVFPLKEGDIVVFPALGGRTEPCAVEGQCDRAARATYEINDVALNEETNRWEIEANYTYELTSSYIEAGAIAQIFLTNAAPFGDLTEGGAESGEATFVGDAAPTDQLTANDFPFFHFEQEYATREDSSYAAARDEFETRIREIDDLAEFSNQPASRKLQSYFVDNLGVNPYLHKITVRFHPFGFVCSWEERMITYTDGDPRGEAPFAGSQIPLSAIWFDPSRLTRDNQEYRCTCGNESGTLPAVCRNGNNECLDPADPDAPPGECP